MSDCTGLGDPRAIKQTSRSIKQSDSTFTKRLDGLEDSANELFRKTQRPGGFGGDRDDAGLERKSATDKSATEMCRIKHALDVPTTREAGPSMLRL
jgi:hypothetical protein